MRRATVYIPEDLKRALEKLAAVRGCTEPQLIREAVRGLIGVSQPPAPKIPLFRSGQPHLAERVDRGLAGFGEH